LRGGLLCDDGKERRTVHFAFFDPEAEVGISHRNLPHWFQPGATYFVTFRTADALPAEVLSEWTEERRRWLLAHGIDPDGANWQIAFNALPKAQQDAFRRLYNSTFHRLLDAGYGACLLKHAEAADIVARAFAHFDGERYQLSDFVVMPNHVHVLLGLLGGTHLADLCYSWKKYTANQINKLFGRRGHFWQGESFDHIVRSGAQFDYFQAYIAANPQLAGLQPGEFVLYRAKTT
jgi:REP element-mobilizing transposase RayT